MSDFNKSAGFVAPDVSDLQKLFPGYEIEGLIATGGMGAVYCAVQKSLDRTVALKILPEKFGKDVAFCEAFEAEAKAMARLNHPNLIGVYDFGEAGGMLFIVMEYVPGQSIYHSSHGIALDQKEVIRLVTGICNGLAHAHEHGIIHRDIKPANILLDLNAQPKIGDFGLARPVEHKVQEGEEIFGTPHYTAPEVVESPQSVDFRADIFSVGVLLHELLTGKLPADDQRPPSMISRCDPRFDVIVRKATNPVPAARYASATEISKDLATILVSLQTRAAALRVPGNSSRVPGKPRTAAPRLPRRRFQSKNKSNSSGFIILLLVVVAAFAAYIYLTKDSLPPHQQPPAAPVVIKKVPVIEPPAEMSADEVMPDFPNDSDPVPPIASPETDTTPDSTNPFETESDSSQKNN